MKKSQPGSIGTSSTHDGSSPSVCNSTTAVLFVCLLVFLISKSAADLPSYFITITPSNAAALEANPGSDNYYPATFSFNDHEYSCSVRYRGASSRTLPKKSWKVKFDNTSNPFKSVKINLNAEYRDRSFMRNYLSFRLFEFMNNPAPQSAFVRLFVNNTFYGIFSQFEEVDEDFLKRNSRDVGSIYKAANHGATMAPLVDYHRYADTWDKQVGDKKEYSDLLQFLNKVTYTKDETFQNSVASFLDVNNFLNYFAIMFVINSFDCFQKNYCLYLAPQTTIGELYPWDSDGSFGNNYDGNYWPELVNNLDGHKQEELNWESLRFNVAFQRLIDIPALNRSFRAKIDTIIHGGFDRLNFIIDSTYTEIKAGVYEDTCKQYSNSDFDDEIPLLHTYLTQRKEVLANNELFKKNPLTDLYCSNPFPNSANKLVTFRSTATLVQPVFVHYLLNLKEPARKVELFDDGEHDDLAAGDRVYGNVVDFSNQGSGITPFSFFTPNWYYQANGFSYSNNTRQCTWALNFNNQSVDMHASIEIGNVYTKSGEYFVEIHNRSDKSIDLSYCHLRGAHTWQDVIIPDITLLKPSETFTVATTIETAKSFLGTINCCPGICFGITPGDTLQILSPAFTPLASKVVTTFSPVTTPGVSIIINEINYNSSKTHDPDDWIELYNSGAEPLDLSGYQLKDSDDSHFFSIPPATTLREGAYLVICRDSTKFRAVYPHVAAVIGNFPFGLAGDGDRVRLYNANSVLQGFVVYGVVAPWPLDANGSGKTLELRNPTLDNSDARSWGPSSTEGGSPGAVNNPAASISSNKRSPVQTRCLVYQYGNTIKVTSTAKNLEYVTLQLFSPDGKSIATTFQGYKTDGLHSFCWDFTTRGKRHLSTGIYLYKMSLGNESVVGRVSIVR